MQKQKILQWLYLANATALISHQVDAAYWHEWDMFGLPGGIQLFLFLNLPITIVLLYGQQALASQRKAGLFFSWLLVVTGLAAFIIHTFFLLQGDKAFTLPFSVGILVGTLILSIAQGAVTLQLQRQPQPPVSATNNFGV